MNMQEAARAAIERCGQEVLLEKDGAVHRFVALVSPAGGASPAGVGRFGFEAAEGYLYRGPLIGGGELVADGDLLIIGEDRFLLSGCRDYRFGGVGIYRQAVAKKLAKEDADGTA